MKVAILAGGLGRRLSSAAEAPPKPLVEIGGRPILWHIMRHYARHGFREFVVALGYKADEIRPAAARFTEDGWTVDLVETGLDTASGGRIARLALHLEGETFMLTWADGLSDVDLGELLAFHRAHGRLATVTAVRPPARFGRLELDGDAVVEFSEKPPSAEWVSGAFFVLEPGALDYVEGDDTQWERGPLERLARDGQLMAFRHEGFWQCMDTAREHELLEQLWAAGDAPWKTW